LRLRRDSEQERLRALARQVADINQQSFLKKKAHQESGTPKKRHSRQLYPDYVDDGGSRTYRPWPSVGKDLNEFGPGTNTALLSHYVEEEDDEECRSPTTEKAARLALNGEEEEDEIVEEKGAHDQVELPQIDATGERPWLLRLPGRFMKQLSKKLGRPSSKRPYWRRFVATARATRRAGWLGELDVARRADELMQNKGGVRLDQCLKVNKNHTLSDK